MSLIRYFIVLILFCTVVNSNDMLELLAKFQDEAELSKITNIPQDKISEVVSKYRIKTLLTFIGDVKKLNQEISDIEKKLKNIEQGIRDEYEKLTN